MAVGAAAELPGDEVTEVTAEALRAARLA
jgi:hypothetical protein